MVLSKKFFASVAAAIVLPLLAAGCGNPSQPAEPPGAVMNKVQDASNQTGVFVAFVKGSTVGQAKDVPCIYVDNNKAGGLSCDWGGVQGISMLEFATFKKVARADGGTGVFTITVEGAELGRSNDVSCVFIDNYNAGGLTCKW